MPAILPRVSAHRQRRLVRPSVVDPTTTKPYTLEQELEPFAHWVGDPIWAPPLDSQQALAKLMLKNSRPFTSMQTRWARLVKEHQREFTQVREIELPKASIRLPKGRFFVSVTQQEDFDKIQETVPDCVQTRLDEFMEGPGKRWGVKVFYLKPLCVEVDDTLVLTTRDDLMKTTREMQQEIIREYREIAVLHRPLEAVLAAINLGLAVPRSIMNYFVERRQKAIDAYHARMEFERRKTALRAARTHCKLRTDGCTFDEMLALTNPLDRKEVVKQYGIEQKLSNAKRDQLAQMAAGSMPWFVTLSLGVSYLSSLSLAFAPPVLMCDPAFVAEMPDSPGQLLKIGHFDEVGGVMHVEL